MEGFVTIRVIERTDAAGSKWYRDLYLAEELWSSMDEKEKDMLIERQAQKMFNWEYFEVENE